MNFDSRPEDIQENNKFLYIWIDILGFREDLNNPEVYDDLFKIREEFRNFFSREKINAQEVISISDGLVLVWDLSNLNLNKVEEIFNSLGKLQMKFILKQKKVLRGAIALGYVSINLYKKYTSQNKKEELKEELKDIFLISNGLVKAYEMESKEIKWPIIATNYETIEELRKIKRINDNNKFFGLQKINGNNEMYLYMIDFLNYLDKNQQIEYEDFLLSKLNTHQNNRKIFEKYYWLLKYYKNKTNNDISEKFKKFYYGVLI